MLQSDVGAGSATSGFMVQFTPEAGRTFRLQSATNLAGWNDVTNFAGTGAPFTFTDRSATNRPRTFYRVRSP
jgi:hypothetical protein